MLMVVNLNPYHTHSGWLHLPLESLGLKPDQPYQLHDLLNDAQYTWSGEYNYVEQLNPNREEATKLCNVRHHIFWYTKH
jgi:starch synthase (maltosyl-transferring)